MMTYSKAILLIAPFLLAACVAEVDDQRAGQGSGNLNGNQGGGEPHSGGSGPGPVSGPAVAMTRAQLDAAWDAYWQQNPPGAGSSTSTGGATLDPNDLFIRISSQGATCGEPTTELSCGGQWQLSLGIPVAAQQVGVYDLDGPLLSLYSSMSETGRPYGSDPDDCSWGGGSVGPGTLEIVSIDSQNVHIKLSATAGFWSSNPSGEYVVPLCP